MIYFVRHGQTDWNIKYKCQGLADIPINKTGEEQARLLKEKLKDKNIEVCFCSPLLRTRQTFEIIVGREPRRDEIDERLIERDFGEFEGFTRSEFDFKGFWDIRNDGKYKSAEDLKHVLDRARALCEDLKKYKDKNILLISHGGFGLVFYSLFLNTLEIKDFRSLEIKHGEVLELNFDELVTNIKNE